MEVFLAYGYALFPPDSHPTCPGLAKDMGAAPQTGGEEKDGLLNGSALSEAQERDR